MFWNPYALPALVGGVLCYFVGMCLHDVVQGRAGRWGMGIVLGLLCLPALSFDLYYVHLAAPPGWYIAWRSMPGIETLAACWGLLFGFLAARVHLGLPGQVLVLALSLLCSAVPFVKPVLHPVEAKGPLQNRWQGTVCLQTSDATCGPASLATIFAAYGRHYSEREIARASYSGASGTELWYLLRFARAHGLRPTRLPPGELAAIPLPALLGVTADAAGPFTRSGHFITLLGKNGDHYRIGDPFGERTLTAAEFQQFYGRVCDVIIFKPERNLSS